MSVWVPPWFGPKLLGGVGDVGLHKPLVLGYATRKPAGGFARRSRRRSRAGGVFKAFVKGHSDVGAETGLNSHAVLRAHEDAAAVDVGGKGYALLLYISQPGQREHLKAAAVGKYRPVPVHKGVQAAKRLYGFGARAEGEVIGVGKLYLAVYAAQVVCRQAALDGGLRAHVHENGGVDGAVGAGKEAAASLALGFIISIAPSHRIIMRSPKLKKRYLSRTASLYALSTFSRQQRRIPALKGGFGHVGWL